VRKIFKEQIIIKSKSWNPPEHWLVIKTIDAHSAGEPLRIIVGGFPDLVGQSILDRRQYAKDHFDHLRKSLMWEPRGHADMYGCIVTEPVSEESDFGVIFTHNEGYSTMCGHGIIAVTKVVLEIGLFPLVTPETILKIDTPAGLITAIAEVNGNTVARVRFQNVPSFVVQLDASVNIPDFGSINYDLAFGGAYYAYVNVKDIGLTCLPKDIGQLIEYGKLIKSTISEKIKLQHPFEDDLNFFYGTIFVGPPEHENTDSRNVCVFADGEIDRSPTGTGVSGRLAIHFARGEIGLDETLKIESILGTTFTGKIIKTVKFGSYDAVIPEISGTAHITGKHEFIIDPKDPLSSGFILR
jgi:trans-L-3-hydroxyproline dehydratase